MTPLLLFYPIVFPALGAILLFLLPRRSGLVHHLLFLAATLLTLWSAYDLSGQEYLFDHPWGGFGFRFTLRLYHFSAFILVAASAFGLLLGLYSCSYMKGRANSGPFLAFFLLTLASANGAILADDLIVLLFFWESLLITLFGMIYLGTPEAFKTALKAFVIVGVTDLCMMVGMALTSHLAGTTQISRIYLDPSGPAATAAFVLLVIGALSKAGSMPFHSWIPDAATDAPLPFMALLPGCFEKLLGIYLLSRICLDMFILRAGSGLSLLLMTAGALTILLAVGMALIQKDFKRLLSFHAISQVGYMVLGIGSAMPAGIVGGIFHMLNNALYKSCLFLTGGAVERQTGTSDLKLLGGIGRYMPLTCLGFFIAALSIAGVPPFNGFFSKELVYEGALQSHWAFYAAALAGSFLTAASFLKLGHAAFFGRPRSDLSATREAPPAMLLPILLLAAVCVLFGLYNSIPLDGFIVPLLGAGHAQDAHHFSGMPKDHFLTGMTLVVLALALFNHWVGVKKSGSGLGASDHIHYAPLLHGLYDAAEKRRFDPYEWGMAAVRGVARLAWAIDRGIDWLYNGLAPLLAAACTSGLRAVHNGCPATYLLWSLVGLALVLFTFLRV